MSGQKALMSISGAAIVLLTVSLTASASVPMELAVHEAARAARRHDFDQVLVVVRENSRSAQEPEIDGVLRAIEKMTRDILKKEPGVEGLVDKSVRQLAKRIKARAGMRPSEVRRYLSVKKADAVLSLDYRNRSGISIEMTLVNGADVYFAERIELEERPDPIDEYLEDTDTDEATSEDSDGKKTEKSESKASKGGKSEIKLAPGSQGIKGTGGKVRRSKVEGRNVRSTSRQQKQSEAVVKAVAAAEQTERKDAPRAPQGPISEIQREVVNFAADNIGKRIGRGECWDLADQALRAAGAEPPRGYTFGTQIPLSEIQPGDILQFTSARFDEPGYWTIMGMPNHTAVVHAVGDTRAFILQQNFDGKRHVTTYDLNLNNLTSGSLEAFRPVPLKR